MNNKDLLNEIIDQMNERGEQVKNINKDNVDENIDDIVDNNIPLNLLTGETYLIDPNTFDWERAAQTLGQIMENVIAFRNMARGLMFAANDTQQDSIDFINNAIEQMTSYLEGYQITVDYRQFNPNLTDHQVAMMMLFDVNNITRTMAHHIELYSVLSMFTPQHSTSNNFFSDEELEKVFADEDAVTSGLAEVIKSYRINAETTEGGITITSIDETDDYEPDEVGIIDEPGEGKMTVVIYAKDLKDARANADAIFGLNSVNDGFDFDASSSGLLDE